MNKKTKRITVGLVSALCLLLVVALGFGVTGAWYRARRQATGVVELDQGIKLIVNNLNEKTLDGDTALTQVNQLKGSFWVATDDAGTKVALQEGTEVSSTNPGTLTKDVIVPTIQADTGSTPFYARAKLDITFKAYNGDRSDVTAAVYELKDLKKSDGSPVAMTDIFDKQLEFANTWKPSNNGYHVYVGGAESTQAAVIAPVTTDPAGPSAPIAVLTEETPKGSVKCDTVTLKDWTNDPQEWVEFGGPIFYVVNPEYNEAEATAQGAAYTTPQYLPIEIAKINFSILIEVIQSVNLTEGVGSAKEAFVGTK